MTEEVEVEPNPTKGIFLKETEQQDQDKPLPIQDSSHRKRSLSEEKVDEKDLHIPPKSKRKKGYNFSFVD